MAKKGFSWKLIILVLYALIAGISNAKEAGVFDKIDKKRKTK